MMIFTIHKMLLFSIYALFMHKKINKKQYRIEDNDNGVLLLDNYSIIMVIRYADKLKNVFAIKNFLLKRYILLIIKLL